jgi:hypothetical protein
MRRFTILILPTQRRGRMGWEFGVRVRLEALDWTGLEGQGLRVLFSGRALHVNLVAAEMPRLRLEAGEQAPQVLRVQEARVAVPFAPKCSCPVQGKLQRYNFGGCRVVIFWLAMVGHLVSLSRGLTFSQ